ncbi:hypothetical protein SAMN05443579_107337 [Variovorax sp. PDC80]|uniref:hypothetical protein n=1 Tax=Variovorax sp. PDC80 TaxID=1882827 RepID=UPI0008E7564B|nr:hypothetical protein [Variovorax sp. PDC80]SFO95931.1 hypothetical protein SAMN05443579_107337 [Variovorax sp. PDC80]
MTALWPWLAVAGLGAFHGLSPANGWMFAAAWGVQARDDGRARRALLPIAVGHFASVAIVALVVAQGLWLDRALVQVLAGAVLLGAAVYRLFRSSRSTIGLRAGHAGLAGWSFVMATAHGAGLMLVPALVPLCLTGDPARAITASGSMALALAAVAVHTAAMLLATGLIATGVCRGIVRHPRWFEGRALKCGWTAALAATGLLLIALR